MTPLLISPHPPGNPRKSSNALDTPAGVDKCGLAHHAVSSSVFSVLDLSTTPALFAESFQQTPRSGSRPNIVFFSLSLEKKPCCQLRRVAARIIISPWTCSSSSKKPQPPPTGSQVVKASIRRLVARRRCWAQSWHCNDRSKSVVRCGVRHTPALPRASSCLRRHEKPVDLHAARERFVAPHSDDLWNPGNAHARHVTGPLWQAILGQGSTDDTSKKLFSASLRLGQMSAHQQVLRAPLSPAQIIGTVRVLQVASTQCFFPIKTCSRLGR